MEKEGGEREREWEKKRVVMLKEREKKWEC